MSTSISTRLVSLRKSKNLSQKEAAEALEVSQALLSHYEKGIRECGLDFLCRASAFYDVSTDYLLGLSDSKMMSDALFMDEEIPQDSEVRMTTVFRSSVYLMEKLSSYGKNYSEKIRSVYILTIYKIYMSALKQGVIPKHDKVHTDISPYLSTSLIDQIIDSIVFDEDIKHKKSEKLPRSLDTLLKEATRVIENQVANMYNSTSKNHKSSL